MRVLSPMAFVVFTSLVAPADAAPRQPDAAVAVGLDDRRGAQLPAGLVFTDAQGRRVVLDQLLVNPDGPPTLLVLAYARCEAMCSAVLGAITESVPQLARAPGRDLRLVLVSLDHTEPRDVAARHQATLLGRIGHSDAPARWPYLVGDEATVGRLADALGFRFARDPASGQFAHPAVVFVLTPDGRLAAPLAGLPLAPAELDTALDVAARGRVLPVATQELLRCFRYMPGRLEGALTTYFRAGAVTIFVVLAGFMAALATGRVGRARPGRAP